MTKLLSVLEAQKVDQISVQKFHLNEEVLMEAAGVLSSYRIQEIYLKDFSKKKCGISIFCGPGNNGGDGLVLARSLYSSGYRNLKVFILKSKGSPLFELQLKRLKKQKIEILNFNYKKNRFSSFDQKIDQIFLDTFLIVDALFGLGFKGDIRDSFLLSLIKKINQSQKIVISLDIPSGLDADTGVLRGSGILAQRTLTFGSAKPGFYIGEGASQVGKIDVLNPGFPKDVIEKYAKSYFLITPSWIQKILPQRKNQGHKYDYGLLLVLSGSVHQWGAGVLVVNAAYRIGAGLVFWASHKEPLEFLKEVPEVQTLSIEDVFHGENFKNRFWQSKRKKAIALGPGLGVGKKIAQVISDLKEKIGKDSSFPVILDADAIRTCSEFKLFPLPSHWVLTPHMAELSSILCSDKNLSKKEELDFYSNGTFKIENPSKSYSLKDFKKKGKKNLKGEPQKVKDEIIFHDEKRKKEDRKKKPTQYKELEKSPAFNLNSDLSVEQILKNRFYFVLKASQIAGCNVLLKGHHSVLASEGKCFIIPTGNAILSKAGSGDVLTGIIGGLMAQGLKGLEATLCASYIHGKIADEWVKEKGENLSLNPSDLKDYFSLVFKKNFILKNS